jgi:Phytanoyl-CoA dioxygenase (PhyH)
MSAAPYSAVGAFEDGGNRRCRFLAWCEEHKLRLFTLRWVDIECFARDLEARGRARATVARRLALCGFLPLRRARGAPRARYVVVRGAEEGQLRTRCWRRVEIGGLPDSCPATGCDGWNMTITKAVGAVTIERFDVVDQPSQVLAALERDGAVVIEGLLSDDVVARVNEEVEAAVAAADPDGPMFNPMAKAFMGAFTKNVPGVPGISRTFATEVMCHPVLLGLADAVLGPSCGQFQLNLGQILQRGPGSEDQWLHRDEGVWADVPKPSPELQLASVIALVDFTRDNGATRVVPGSHRWPDRHLPMDAQLTPTAHQIAVAEMRAGSAAIDTGGVIHGGGANTIDRPRRAVHLSYCLGWPRTEENNYLSIPPAIAAGLPRRPRRYSATPCTTASLGVAGISAWCGCRIRSICSPAMSFEGL